MASKSKRRSRGRSAANRVDQLRRNLERGDFKRALKDARCCYRQDATPQQRLLLEHAYIGRAQQLAERGQIEDSRRIARDLLDFGVTEPSVEAGLPDLLLSVGMLDCLPQGVDGLTRQERERLRVRAADQAVVRPEATPKSMPELKRDALAVRAALEAVERGEESAALADLKPIPRRSLFADWRYFVRGLIAYYQRDTAGMLANWDRLDADRGAARIAAPLRALAGVGSPPQDADLRSKISRLEKQATDQTVFSQLTRLGQFAAEQQWRQVFKTLRAVRGPLRALDAGCYRRLVSWVCGTLVSEGLVDELERLAGIADPLPLDPRWNRAKAVACEMGDFYNVPEAETYWRKYLDDLESLPALSAEERDLARGLVWLHLAEFRVSDAMELRGCRCGADHEPDVEEAEQHAREAFEQCFTLAPAYAPAFAAAARFHVVAGRREEAAGVYRRLLEHVPDQLEALVFLGQHHAAAGQFRKARQFAERARQQKPLDRQIIELLWTTHVGAARELARAGRYDRAREEFAAADRLLPARKEAYHVLARKAVLEIKAGCGAAARRLVGEAQERLQEPAALWLVMTIESIRHELPIEERWLYEKRWHEALMRRCRSESAGLMCEMLNAHLKAPRPYPGLQEHARDLLQYLRRSGRVKWQAGHLRWVCEFLEHVEELPLVAKLAKQGVRKFPEVGYFQWLMGMAEVAKGPGRCDRRRAVDHFEEAVRLASTSSDSRDKEVVENARRCLRVLERPLGHFDEEDDDGDWDEDEGDDDEGDPEVWDGGPDGVLPKAVYDVVRRICSQTGLDPEAVLDELISGHAEKPRQTRRNKR